MKNKFKKVLRILFLIVLISSVPSFFLIRNNIIDSKANDYCGYLILDRGDCLNITKSCRLIFSFDEECASNKTDKLCEEKEKAIIEHFEQTIQNKITMFIDKSCIEMCKSSEKKAFADCCTQCSKCGRDICSKTYKKNIQEDFSAFIQDFSNFEGSDFEFVDNHPEVITKNDEFKKCTLKCGGYSEENSE